MVHSVLLASVVALSAFLSPADATYNLAAADNYQGAKFFDFWNFRSTVDPTAGYVDYQTRAQAQSRVLIRYDSATNRNHVFADNKVNLVGSTARGRASVRLESKLKYTKGMFVADLAHMPEEACGVWPAFWTVNQVDSYPKWGEIDILENINEQTSSLNVLHTSPKFTITNSAARMNDVVDQTNCADVETQNQGCAARNTRAGSYGKAFNARGGGIVVMEWTSTFIKMWNFAPGKQPASLKAGHPAVDKDFPKPDFDSRGGTGKTVEHFKDHQIIFDTTFCGNYAGQDQFWKQTSCYKTGKYPTCKSYVAANPAAFSKSYWTFNSVKVYKWTNP